MWLRSRRASSVGEAVQFAGSARGLAPGRKGKIAAKDYYDSLMKDAKGAPEPEKKVAPPVPTSR